MFVLALVILGICTPNFGTSCLLQMTSCCFSGPVFSCWCLRRRCRRPIRSWQETTGSRTSSPLIQSVFSDTATPQTLYSAGINPPPTSYSAGINPPQTIYHGGINPPPSLFHVGINLPPTLYPVGIIPPLILYPVDINPPLTPLYIVWVYIKYVICLHICVCVWCFHSNRSYLDMMKVIMFSYLFWFVLTIIFITGTTRLVL